MAKEVVKKEAAGAVSTEVLDGFDFESGADQFSARDLMIPRLLVQQAMSKAVHADLAKAGDILDTARNEVVGSLREKDRKPVHVYPLQMFRYWVRYDITPEGRKFAGAEPWTPSNENREWDVKDHAGVKVGENEETVVFAVVRADQIDDLSEPPRLLSFRKTSLKHTKALKHHFLMCMSTRKEVPFQTEFVVGGRQEKNDKGQFYVMEALPGKKLGAVDPTVAKLFAFYKQYGQLIKDKIQNLVGEEEISLEAQGAPRDVTAEGGRAEF